MMAHRHQIMLGKSSKSLSRHAEGYSLRSDMQERTFNFNKLTSRQELIMMVSLVLLPCSRDYFFSRVSISEVKRGKLAIGN